MQAIQERLSASELQVGNLQTTMGTIQTTLTAQAQNSESTRTLLEQLSRQVSQVMAAHDQVHQEMAEVRSQIRNGGGPGRRAKFNPKDLKLELLGDPACGGYRQQWAEWSDKAKDYMSLLLPDIADLRRKLTQLEALKDPLSPDEIRDAGIDAGVAAEF